MDVRCERCQTEYEFDDALVSDRGTTVKCTNCGFQFKVFPIGGGGGTERWSVRSTTGTELTYHSLRDLQRAISQGNVVPEDVLLREGHPPRTLRSIAELEPFFGIRRPPDRAKGTLVGVAPPASVAAEPPAARSPSDRPLTSDASARSGAGSRARTTTAPKLPRYTAAPIDAPSHSDHEPPTMPFEQERVNASPPSPGARAAHPSVPVPRPSGDGTGPRASAADGPFPDGGARNPPTSPEPSPRPGTAPALAATQLSAAHPPAAVRRPAPEPEPIIPANDEDEAGAAPDATAPLPAPSPVSAPVAAGALGGTVRLDPAPSGGHQGVANTRPGGAAAATGSSLRTDPIATGAAEAPRAVPEVAPAPRAPAVAAAAAVHPEIFYTPPPREVSFAGSLSEPDPRYVPPSRARPARFGWIVALVVLGGLALVAATVGLTFLRGLAGKSGPPSVAAAASADPRVASFVADGQKQLSAGDLEAATESFAKASALAEGEPAVLKGIAELEVQRADLAWLRLRLLDAGDPEAVSARRDFTARMNRARGAVERALAAPIDAVAASRLRVDLLRLDDQVPQARPLVAPLAERASEPGIAYVLGMLDLAEATPAFRSASARLRIAAAGEGRVGRARAALVYALVRAGDLDAARRELGLLASTASGHPLEDALTRFVERSAAELEDAGSDAAVADDGGEPAAYLNAEDAGVGLPAGDFRERLKLANAALGNHELDRAKRLYRSVLSEQPGNTEALAGVAEVARQQNDPSAGELYDKVLEKNPSYVPAIVARADQKWAAGDRSGATALYQRVLSQVGTDSSYGRHAAARIAEGAKSGPAGTAPRPAPPTSPPAPAPEGGDAPQIDTTDLPGMVP